MNQSPSERQTIQGFVRFLHQLRLTDNRAKLAELRRAAADPANDIRSIIILGNHLPDPVRFPTAFRTYQLVAVLFAIHSQRFNGDNHAHVDRNAKNRSLGTTLRKLRGQLYDSEDSSDEKKNGLDMRVKAVLNARIEDVAIPLRGLIQRIASAERPIPVDFTQLLNDLLFWGRKDAHHRKWNPQQRWAQDYFVGPFASEDAPNEGQNNENSNNQP